MIRYLPALRSVLAVVAGYLAIVLGNILTLEVLLDGIGWGKSSPVELALATIGALLAGLAGGHVAGWVAGRKPLLHAVCVLIPLTLDTINVLVTGISQDPLWFDLGGSLTLMAATVLGGYLLERRWSASGRAATAA